jgi:hypothetical protein
MIRGIALLMAIQAGVDPPCLEFARDIHLKLLIAVAYAITDFQVYGNVPWLESERYDLEARAPGPAEFRSCGLCCIRCSLWVTQRETELLPVSYFHIVFTSRLPALCLGSVEKTQIHQATQGQENSARH